MSRWIRGQPELLRALALELVRLEPDVIVTAGRPAALAAHQMTRRIPIVMPNGGDPVAVGLVHSLAAPGGNVTGLSSATAELPSQRLALLQEAMPQASRVAVLHQPPPDGRPFLLVATAFAAAAQRLHLTLLSAEADGPDAFEAAFATLRRERVEALVVQEHPVHWMHRRRIAELAAQHRVPALYGSREYVEAGGLMSYGVNFTEHYRRAADYVDRILHGANPADLPVAPPTAFELVINRKAAQALGLTLPPSFLLRAEAVPE